MKMKVDLLGDGYTQEQALALKAEVVSWASTNNFKGSVIIAEELIA